MKRVLIVAVLVLALMLALVACGQKAAVEEASVPAQEEETASVANPWREVTQEEAQALCAKSFNVPEGAENVVWSVNDSVADASGVPGALVQVAFDLNGMSFTARAWVKTDDYWDVYFQLMEEIPTALGKAGVGGPLPAYHIVND